MRFDRLPRLLGLAMLLSVGAQAAAEPPEAGKATDLGKNAALAYWQAFALMPEAQGAEQQALVSSTDLELLKQAENQPVAEKLVAASEASLRMLHAAAAMPHCDWQLQLEGPSTLLPHVSKARALARLALLRARQRAVSGDLPGAAADVADVYCLARDVDHGVLIETLVGIAIEGQANAVTRQLLPLLKPAEAAALLKRLNALPAASTFADAILAEKKVFGEWLAQELNGKSAAEITKQLEILGVANALMLSLQGPEVTKALLDDFVKNYDRMAEASRQADAAEQLKAQEEQIKDSDNVFIRLLMPAARRAFEVIEKARGEFAEVKSALAAKAK